MISLAQKWTTTSLWTIIEIILKKMHRIYSVDNKKIAVCVMLVEFVIINVVCMVFFFSSLRFNVFVIHESVNDHNQNVGSLDSSACVLCTHCCLLRWVIIICWIHSY